MAGSDLVAPVLLLAMPQVNDPFFRKSVVLLLVHEEQGSFGFVVNRDTELKVAEILRDLELEWGGDDEALAGFGGPVQPHVGTVLFAPGPDEAVPELESASEVAAGIHLTQHLTELAEIAIRPPARFRLLLGHAGWGEGQLVAEILRNDWLIAPVDNGLVFGSGVEAVWEAALRSVGVDPETLPAWTGSEDEGPAN
jgi:putative transcriptional regulator